MKSSTKDKSEGAFHQVKGQIKESWGKSQRMPIWKQKAKVKS